MTTEVEKTVGEMIVAIRGLAQVREILLSLNDYDAADKVDKTLKQALDVIPNEAKELLRNMNDKWEWREIIPMCPACGQPIKYDVNRVIASIDEIQKEGK